jgi:hypothetical protein
MKYKVSCKAGKLNASRLQQQFRNPPKLVLRAKGVPKIELGNEQDRLVGRASRPPRTGCKACATRTSNLEP